MIENRLSTRSHFGFYLRIFSQILKLARRLLSEDVIYCQQVEYYRIEPWFFIFDTPLLFFLSGSSLFSWFKRGDEKIGKEHRSTGTTKI